VKGDGSVHIIDDDEPTRDSLHFLLVSSGLNATAHESATAFLDALGGLSPSCVVTDVKMPDVNGIDVLKAIKTRRPETPVIVITGHGDIALAVEAMKLGASDFLEKPYADDAMIAAIEAALKHQGGSDRQSEEREGLLAKIEQLSPREKQVLIGVVAGKPNKIIAHELDISPRTVEVYRANLMTKMRASNLSHLVRMALLAGIDGSNRAPPG
jgi:two-component system response regulator FixJ